MEQDTSSFVPDHKLIQALETRPHPVSCDEDRSPFRQAEAPGSLSFSEAPEEVMCLRAAS